jgi:uncharacterized protein
VTKLVLPTSVVSPPESEEVAPYWAATRERRLVLPWCDNCGTAFWFPRAVCPHCLGQAIAWKESTGLGVLYAFSVHRRPGPGRSPEDGPYAVALVQLEDGVRLMSNIIGCSEDDLTVGMSLELCWFPLADDRALPFFAPLVVARPDL